MPREAGFTLLEVLVAFVIAALALGVLFSGGIGGLTASTTALRYGEALSRARSHLAEAAGPDVAAADRGGAEGNGFDWHVRVQPVALGTASEPGRPIPALYAVTVTETWSEGGQTRSVTLQTQRAGSAPPPPP